MFDSLLFFGGLIGLVLVSICLYLLGGRGRLLGGRKHPLGGQPDSFDCIQRYGDCLELGQPHGSSGCWLVGAEKAAKF